MNAEYKVNVNKEFSNLQKMIIPGIRLYMITVIIGFLVIHAGFYLVVAQQKLTGMIIIEILTLISYVHLLYKIFTSIKAHDARMLSNFITVVLLEVDIYMVLSAIMMGQECCFDQYVYGLLLITSFQFYINRELKTDIILKVVVIGSYLLIKVYETSHPPLYQDIPAWVIQLFSFANPTIVISAIVLFALMVPMLIFKYENALAFRASIDSLTGLYNRFYFENIKPTSAEYGIAILDIDDFKGINDAYGHDNGDLVLKHLGGLLKDMEQQFTGILTARWGGEEFVILSHGLLAERTAFLQLLEQLRREICQAVITTSDGRPITYQISAGIAFSREKQTYEKAFKLADKRLYTAKQTGKNRINASDPPAHKV